MIAGAVLASGAGRRFGETPKQLAPFGDRPLVQHAVDAQAEGGLDRRGLVVGAHAEDVLAAVDLRGAEAVRCEDWEEGMAASLRAAVAWAGDATWLLVTLGDQPRVGPSAVRAIVEAAGLTRAPAVRATFGGVGGHPVALHRSLWPAVAELRGDEGARALLDDAEELDLGHLASPEDVDTPHDLEALAP